MFNLISRFIPLTYWREALEGAAAAAIWTSIFVLLPTFLLFGEDNSKWAYLISGLVFGILSGCFTADKAKTRIMQEGIDWYCEENGL